MTTKATKGSSNVVNLQGKNEVWYARPLSMARTNSGMLIPAQTGGDFDLTRDSDSTATKQGAVPTSSSLEADTGVDFINNSSWIADHMYDSILDGEVLEIWKVNLDRRNAAGQYFAWYWRATVSEDSGSGDADDNATREIKFATNGTPVRGWLTLNEEEQAEIDYVFRGLAPVTDDDDTGDGKEWDSDADAGVSATDDEIAAASTSSTTPETPADDGSGDTETGK